MARPAAGAWVDQMGALTETPGEGPGDDIAAARASVARLVASARPVALEAARTFPRTQLGDLAVDLSRLDAPPVTGVCDPAKRRARFLEALRGASTAVYICRRVLHPGGTCLFGSFQRTDDLCGRVLVAAHCVGDHPSAG